LKKKPRIRQEQYDLEKEIEKETKALNTNKNINKRRQKGTSKQFTSSCQEK
jgi:hypothetical protein